MNGKHWLLLVVPAVTILAACDEHTAPQGDPKSPAPVVQTIRAEMRDIADTLAIPARVQPDPADVVRVYPPAGGRLLRVNVRPGDHVRRGQSLVVLQSSDVAQARADYEKARTEAERNQHAFERAKLLFSHEVLSEREYEDAQAAYQEARTELDRASDRLRVLGVSLQGSSNEVSLIAPRDGVIIDLGAAPGELSKSTDNANPICTIADLRTVWIVGDVYEKDLSSLHSGESVDITVSAFPDQHWNGKLSVISDTLDPQTRTLKARVVLENPKQQLKPEMFATINVRRPQRQAVVVPASALLHEGGDTAVMVQAASSKYERRLVNVSSADASEAVIANGLQPGELVVTQGAALVRGGEGQE